MPLRPFVLPSDRGRVPSHQHQCHRPAQPGYEVDSATVLPWQSSYIACLRVDWKSRCWAVLIVSVILGSVFLRHPDGLCPQRSSPCCLLPCRNSMFAMLSTMSMTIGPCQMCFLAQANLFTCAALHDARLEFCIVPCAMQLGLPAGKVSGQGFTAGLTADMASAMGLSRCWGAAEAVSEAGEGEKLSFVQRAKTLAGALGPAYWEALAVVCLLYFARFDASFITLRAKTVYIPTAGNLTIAWSSCSQCNFGALKHYVRPVQEHREPEELQEPWQQCSCKDPAVTLASFVHIFEQDCTFLPISSVADVIVSNRATPADYCIRNIVSLII